MIRVVYDLKLKDPVNQPSYDSWFWSYRWYFKVHDFGPVGDEDNWSTLDNPMLELDSLYSLLATVLPTSKLNASKSSLFPILEKSPDENPMNLIFIILTGPNAEETATSLYISLFYKTNKGKFITWSLRLLKHTWVQFWKPQMSSSLAVGEIVRESLLE